MIYQTGSIKTTAGQTKITGTGTRWKDNLAGISEGCPISYLINNIVYMNTVLSVNSDIEINLTYPVPVAASAAKYQIATFVLDSMSDGVRKMLANQLYIQYFLRNMDTWLTQDGIVEIKTPTGEVVRLESILALKKLIDGKYEKKGGAIDGNVTVIGSFSANEKIESYKSVAAVVPNSVGAMLDASGDKPVLKVRESSALGWKNHSFQNKDGTLMHIGDFGWGSRGEGTAANTDPSGVIETFRTRESRIWRTEVGGSDYVYRYAPNLMYRAGDTFTNISTDIYTAVTKITTGISANTASYKTSTLWGTSNTTVDSQGNIKKASPVIKVFAGHIELNDESEGITLEKISTGRYKLKGTLGMNSDASWGGYNGGIVIPKGINGLELVWADYKVLADGDIIIETHYRKHTDLPPPILLKRLTTYPEFMDEKGNELESYAPCDIPAGHWIDVRVNMPSDSIYNQKLAEAERLAKIEAERGAKEESEKVEPEVIGNADLQQNEL